MTVTAVEPFDSDAWITECLQKGEQVQSTFTAIPVICRWCDHHEHGFRCKECTCDSSYTSRDDSWRPPLEVDRSLVGQQLAFMHQTGVDGWVAKIACTSTTFLFKSPKTRSARIRDSLLGKTR